MEPIVTFKQVMKHYKGEMPAVRGVSLAIFPGEFTALSGPSGSGKTTLLNLAAGLDVPSQGSVSLLGKPLEKMCLRDRTTLIRHHLGFIFQSYNLFPMLTVMENVLYPLVLRRIPRRKRREVAMNALKEVGMDSFIRRYPKELSGGQQQRVAIARAVAGAPKLILADEPTANLDTENAMKLISLLEALNNKAKLTVLFSSHDPRILCQAKRIVEVVDGSIKSDTLITRYDTSQVQSPLPISSLSRTVSM